MKYCFPTAISYNILLCQRTNFCQLENKMLCKFMFKEKIFKNFLKKKFFIHPSCYIKDSFLSHLMTLWIFGRLSFLGSWKWELSCKRIGKMKKQEGILWHVSNGCFQEVLSYAKDTNPYAVCTFLNKVLEHTAFLQIKSILHLWPAAP